MGLTFLGHVVSRRSVVCDDASGVRQQKPLGCAPQMPPSHVAMGGDACPDLDGWILDMTSWNFALRSVLTCALIAALVACGDDSTISFDVGGGTDAGAGTGDAAGNSDGGSTDASGTDSGGTDAGGDDAGGDDAGGDDAGGDDDGGLDASTDTGSDAPDDPCAALPNACDLFGTTCNGAILEVCSFDDEGCLVLDTLDCAELGGVCDPVLLMCMGGDDPCAERNECEVAGSICDANGDIEDCAPDAFGCLERTLIACESDGLGECTDGGFGVAFCEDPCDLVVECPAETFCDGDVVTCAPDENGCLVESARESCDEGLICNPETFTCTDPCAGLALCEAADAGGCDGEVATSCVEDENGCLVERVSDCADLGVACVEGELGGECEGAGACDVEAIIGCGDTVVGDTAGGGTAFPEICLFADYEGPERVYAFTHDETAFVTVTATWDASGDFDLFALDGADGCDVDTACLEFSRSTLDSETVTFASPAGESQYVVFDVFNNAELTTAFTLEVTCEIPDCGNGIVENGEGCDDEGREDGDGCSATCAVESGYVCEGEGPSVCRVVECGDGLIEGDEECDDSGVEPLDGCDDTCTIEGGYLCTGEPSDCERVCGNGTLDGAEECDDSNEDAGDGCSDSCAIEEGYSCREIGFGRPSICATEECGNGLLDGDEACDDANLEAADGCDELCALEEGFRAVGAATLPDACFLDGSLDYAAVCEGDEVGVDCASPCTFTVPEAGSLQLAGALEEGDLLWDRLTGCTAADGPEDHFVDLYVIDNADAPAFTMDLIAEWSADGYLHVYEGAVDIRIPDQDCVAFNDDANGTAASRLSVEVPANGSVVIAASTFTGAATIDEYTLTARRE